jgi:uncharacterized protein
MKWRGRRQSDNVEDRRTLSGGGKAAAGGGIIGIVVLVLTMFGGEQGKMAAGAIKNMNGGQSGGQSKTRELSAQEKEIGDFTKVCLADNEETWNRLFKEQGISYKTPTMVLFSGQVETGCGGATAAVGPFYCPADQKVYMDLSFFEELKNKFGAKGGDFATAYVLAHEVGHHIQTIIGTSQSVNQLQANASDAEKNKLSVCQELQADFYAGVWAHHNMKYMEVGDLEEALSAAQAVGDDHIQQKMQGRVADEETFTHGTSAQRMKWFKKGYETGDVTQGNTYAANGYRVRTF